jgi:hypothetical protein
MALALSPGAPLRVGCADPSAGPLVGTRYVSSRARSCVRDTASALSRLTFATNSLLSKAGHCTWRTHPDRNENCLRDGGKPNSIGQAGRRLVTLPRLAIDLRGQSNTDSVHVGMKDVIDPNDATEKRFDVPLTSPVGGKSFIFDDFTGLDRRQVPSWSSLSSMASPL